MPLPKVSTLKIKCDLPLSGKKVFFRPMKVREQKDLLLAQQSEDQDTIYETIRGVIHECTFGDVDLETLPLTDLSWLFIQMRISSAGAEQKVAVKCDNPECGESIPMVHDLNGASVEKPGKDALRVELDSTMGLIFRWPTITDYVNAFQSKDATLKYIFMIVDQAYDAEQVYTKNDFTEEEFEHWLEDLDDRQLKKIADFMSSIPELRQELKFKCPHCQHEHRKLLEGLQDFFRLGDDQ
jgi:hypothetical protein